MSHSVAVELHVAVSRAIREAVGAVDDPLVVRKGETLSIDVRWIGEQPSLFEGQLERPWESAPGIDDQGQTLP